MNSDIETFINNTAARLQAAGIEYPRLDVRMLLSHALGISLDELMFYPRQLASDKLSHFEQMIEQRLHHKPVDKIIGSRGFYKYDFQVSPAVLSPRPDTETLVEAAIEYINLHQVKNILDLGTGSGCILLSILAEFPELSGVGIDASKSALEIASNNAYKLNTLKRTELYPYSWFDDNLPEELGRRFDVIVSNPPYIPSADISKLDKEVKAYDPMSALDGGEDGLRDYRKIAEVSPKLLNNDGIIFLEIGIGQAEDVAKIFCFQGFKPLQIIKDLGGIERCVILKK